MGGRILLIPNNFFLWMLTCFIQVHFSEKKILLPSLLYELTTPFVIRCSFPFVFGDFCPPSLLYLFPCVFEYTLYHWKAFSPLSFITPTSIYQLIFHCVSLAERIIFHFFRFKPFSWFSFQMIRRQHPFFFQSEVRWTSTHIVNPNKLQKMHERLEMNQFSFFFLCRTPSPPHVHCNYEVAAEHRKKYTKTFFPLSFTKVNIGKKTRTKKGRLKKSFFFW